MFNGVGEPVAKVVNRFIPGPTADLPIKIYTPEGKGPFPAIVYFHGSGFVVCNIDFGDPANRELANRSGCVIIAVNYQKAPEHKFPTGFDDCYATARWVIDNASELNIDPGKVGVGGDSAGGNLAAACCLRARDENGPKFAFQMLIYPATDLGVEYPSQRENAEGYGLTSKEVASFRTQYLNRPEDIANPYVSPMRAADHSGLPPAIVATAELDPIRDDGEAYADRLKGGRRPDGQTSVRWDDPRLLLDGRLCRRRPYARRRSRARNQGDRGALTLKSAEGSSTPLREESRRMSRRSVSGSSKRSVTGSVSMSRPSLGSSRARSFSVVTSRAPRRAASSLSASSSRMVNG